jgi:hypothetical protein
VIQIHDPETDDVLKEMFVIILEHPILRKYFLEQSLGSSRTTQITAKISLLIAQVVAKIPKSVDVTLHLKPYLDKISTCWENQDVMAEGFLSTIAGFVKLIDSKTIAKMTLALLDSEDVKEYLRHPQEGSIFGEHVMCILQELGSHERLSQHSIPLAAISCLAITITSTANEELLRILTTILQRTPTYAIALNESTFEYFLQWKTSNCDSLMKILLSSQPSHRQLFLEWLESSRCLKKKQAKWRVAEYVLYYLHGCTGK